MTTLRNIISSAWYRSRSAEYYRWYPHELQPADVPFQPTPAGVDGAYVHVPYCDDICAFCPFNRGLTADTDLEDFVGLIVQEIQLYARHGVHGPLSFVYLGGGTPSVLPGQLVSRLLSALHRSFGLTPDCEVTLEVHPTHLTNDRIKAYADAGVSRISSGIQSFDGELLGRIGATHSSLHSARGLEVLDASDLEIAIDLLYRCPGQTIEGWLRDIARATMCERLHHVSCYSLSLATDAEQPSNDVEVEMAITADAMLEHHGLRHYASCATGGYDHARSGHECRYELKHWGAPQASYLGLGPGAFGFLGNRITINLHSARRYHAKLRSGCAPLLAVGVSSASELRHRYFVLGVKTLSVEFRPFAQVFNEHPSGRFSNAFAKLTALGMCNVGADGLRLTETGRHFVDQVSTCFWSEAQRQRSHPETRELLALESAGWYR